MDIESTVDIGYEIYSSIDLSDLSVLVVFPIRYLVSLSGDLVIAKTDRDYAPVIVDQSAHELKLVVETDVESDNYADNRDDWPDEVVVPVHVISINDVGAAEEGDDDDEDDVEDHQRDQNHDE